MRWPRRRGIRCLLEGIAATTVLLGVAPAQALVVDDFEAGAQTNLLGGTWVGYADAGTSRTPTNGIAIVPGFQSAGAGQFAFRFGSATTYPYAGAATNLTAAGTTYDLSGFAGIAFQAKGSGSFLVQVATTATMAEGNHYSTSFNVGVDFARVEVRLSALTQMFGTMTPFDPTTAVAINFTAAGTAGMSGELVLDDIELLTEADLTPVESNPIVASPKLNQVGFLPMGPKRLTMTVTGAAPPTAFEVRTPDGFLATRGALSASIDETSATGERVVTGDFSELSVPGKYVVVVDGVESVPFVVSDTVYTSLYRDAIRAFYLIRSGVAINDIETGIAHPASHTSDAVLRSDGTTHLDLVGGWYNAGDYGKWSHMAALSTSYMLTLEELRGQSLDGVDLGIPESGNGVPDLLDQARWGLEWLLRMQRDDGAVIHKVDTEPNFAWGLPPQSDPNERFASGVGTIDTADFAAVMTQAGRAYRSVDAAFADTCEAAAARAFAWVDAQPPTGNTDPYYTDPSDSDERLWALVERARTGDSTLVGRATSAIARWAPSPASWQTPSILGVAGLARDPAMPSALRDAARTKIHTLAESLAALGETNGYGVAATAGDYYWGSVEVALHRAAALVLAADLEQSSRFRDAALGQFDYVLGRNSLGHSFVTHYGQHSTVHPYHWTLHALGVLMPGWASGGPNSSSSGADAPLVALQKLGTPAAKCYLDQGDASGSWASNEGQTTENAALAFVAGYFAAPSGSSLDGGPASSDGGSVSSPAGATQRSGCGCSVPGGDRPQRSSLAALAALVFLRQRRPRLNTPKFCR